MCQKCVIPLKSQELTQVKIADIRMGEPVPLEKVVRPYIRRELLEWLKVFKAVPPGKMVEVKSRAAYTARAAFKQLIKKGLVSPDKYVLHVDYWLIPEKRKIWIIHLPSEKEARNVFLKDLEAKKLEKRLRALGVSL